jgi:hypothetical protein
VKPRCFRRMRHEHRKNRLANRLLAAQWCAARRVSRRRSVFTSGARSSPRSLPNAPAASNNDAAGDAGDADRRTQKRHDSGAVAARYKHAFGGLSVRFLVGQSVRNLRILHSFSAHGRPALAHLFFTKIAGKVGRWAGRAGWRGRGGFPRP